MVVYEEIYFEAYTNDQCISHKNNIAELYWNFSNIPQDGSDIHRFSHRRVGLNHGHNWKSVNMRGWKNSNYGGSCRVHMAILPKCSRETFSFFWGKCFKTEMIPPHQFCIFLLVK